MSFAQFGNIFWQAKVKLAQNSMHTSIITSVQTLPIPPKHCLRAVQIHPHFYARETLFVFPRNVSKNSRQVLIKLFHFSVLLFTVKKALFWHYFVETRTKFPHTWHSGKNQPERQVSRIHPPAQKKTLPHSFRSDPVSNIHPPFWCPSDIYSGNWRRRKTKFFSTDPLKRASG